MTEKGAEQAGAPEKNHFGTILESMKDITAEVINYLVIVAVIYGIGTVLIKREVTMPVWILSLWIPIFFYCLRVWCKRMAPFFLLHLLPLAEVLVLDKGEQLTRIAFVGVWLFLLAVSIHKRITSGDGSFGMTPAPPPLAAGLFLALYLLDRAQCDGGHGARLLQMLILYACGYLVYYFLQQFIHYMDATNRTAAHIPTDRIFYSAAALTGGFILITAVVLVAVLNREWLDQAGMAIRDAFVGFIRWFFSLFPKGQTQAERELLSQPGMLPGMEMLPPEGETPWWVKVLDILLSVGAILLLSAASVGALISLYRFIRNAFTGGRKTQDIQRERNLDYVENLRRQGKKEKKRREGWVKRLIEAGTPEQRIRRLYRKTMDRTISRKPSGQEREQMQQILHHATARECCRAFFPRKAAEAEAFAVLYEKARYGRGLCGKQEFQQAIRLAGLLSSGE